MTEENKCIRPKSLCVNVDKVYDWVIEESTGSTSVPIGSLPTSIPAEATNIKIKVILTDHSGHPVPLNVPLNITESTPREDKQFTIDGSIVTLQRVSFSKNLYVVLEICGVDPSTGHKFLVSSHPISFTFFETAFLCAPVGTSLIVKVSSFDYLTFIRRNETGKITHFSLNIFICQSIQTIAPVTVEIGADYCKPREQVTEHCGVPNVPQECSVVFP